MNNKFGLLIRQIRISQQQHLREIARRAEISAPYLYDIETGNRKTPSWDVLQKIVEALQPTDTQKYQIYDAAGKDKETIPPDVENYILKNPIIIKAIRMAEKCTVSTGEWQEFIDRIQQKRTRTYPIPKKIQTKLEKPVTLLK